MTDAHRIQPIVITRFAVRTRQGAPPPAPWVTERFQLLGRLPRASLERSTIRAIEWVLLVDESHRDLVADLLPSLTLPAGHIQLGVCVGLAPTTGEIALDHEIAAGEADFVTFRLDSDDALLPTAIADALEIAADAPDGALVDFPCGYRLDLRSGSMRQIVHEPDRQGPFLAIRHRSRATMLDTGGEHAAARHGRPLLTVPEPSWIQVVHGGNQSNRMPRSSLRRRVSAAVATLVTRRGRPVHGRLVPPDERDRLLASAGVFLGA